MCKKPNLPDKEHICIFAKCELCNKEKLREDKEFWNQHFLDHAKKLKSNIESLELEPTIKIEILNNDL